MLPMHDQIEHGTAWQDLHLLGSHPELSLFIVNSGATPQINPLQQGKGTYR